MEQHAALGEGNNLHHRHHKHKIARRSAAIKEEGKKGYGPSIEYNVEAET